MNPLSPRPRVSASPRLRPPHPRVSASPRLPAFTLVEVLVSIVIALLLIVGISKIFGLAQQSSGMGTTLCKINDTTRTIQAVLQSDFQNIITDPSISPGFVIASYPVATFRNAQDQQQGPDQLHPLIFPLPGQSLNTVQNTPFCQAYATNYRVHRTDRMCFFESGQFQRQTGDPKPNGDANIVTPGSATEAFVWIGHLALPNNPGVQFWNPNQPDTPQSPGDFFGAGSQVGQHRVPPATSTNGGDDNNYFASDWILGRSVTLLAQKFAPYTGSYYLDLPNPNLTTVPLSLMAPTGAPLSTVQGTAATNNPIPNYASRTDILYDPSDPITTFHRITANLGGNFSTDGFYWWEDLIGIAANKLNGTINPRGASNKACQPYFANPLPTKPDPSNPPGYQAWTNNASTWLSAAAAQTAPIFVRGCSQFIVEFAGDYAYQNPDGSINQVKTAQGLTDGQIDFIVDKSNPDSTKWTKRIRWYGFPRNTSSPAPSDNTLPGPPVPDAVLDQYDVIPVKWFLGNTPVLGDAWFEKSVPQQMGLPTTQMPISDSGSLSNVPPQAGPAYICAWGPDVPAQFRPKLIRITIAIDEPTGRLNTEQTYEFIFALP